MRQRRTIRFVQVLLVAIAAGLLFFAGYSLGRVEGYDSGRRANDLGAPRSPSVVQSVVLVSLGLGSLTAAFLVQGDRTVRIPTPARLEELTGRAEAAAVERAERVGSRNPS
jgi:hypothetical protein